MHFNQEQFSILYETYFARMIRFASVYIENRQDAENMVQDLFLYLWEHQTVWQEVNNMDAFLFTLLKNRCINFLKHEACLRRVNDEQEMQRQLNLESLKCFEEVCDEVSEIKFRVQKAVAKLPERCREILVLSKLKRMKYREIAEKLGLSVNTVENQMSIALKKLRDELKDYLP